MSKRLLVLTLITAIAAGGGLFYYRSRQAAKVPTPVTAEVTRGDVIAKVDATGSLAPVTTVQVGSQVSGTVKALLVDYNAEVRKSQVIAELDSSLFQTQVDQARATLVKSQSDVDRSKVEVDDSSSKLRRAQELWEQKLISRNDLETAQSTAMQAQAALRSAEAQVTQARAALNQAQVNLGHTVIRSPIDGTVISRNVDVGQTVAASMSAPTLYVIAQDLTHMQVSASIDESDIGRIGAGQLVTFRVDAYPQQTFRGTVKQVRLDAKTDQNVVSYTTMIDVPNEDLRLKPGMTANVTVQTAANEDVLRVPNSALRFAPTPELFAALGQEAPQQLAGAGGSRGVAGAAGTAGQAAGETNRLAEGRGRLAQLTPEERAQFAARFTPEQRAQFAQMTPEQRAQFRLAQRSSQSEGGARGVAAGDPPVDRAGSSGGATGFGRVWALREGKLQLVRVRTGVTDGATTAIVGGELKEGDRVVTGITEPGAAVANQTTPSPLLPFGRRGGANRGGGAGAAGGARGGAGR
jgi:HlyD family secretion protein